MLTTFYEIVFPTSCPVSVISFNFVYCSAAKIIISFAVACVHSRTRHPSTVSVIVYYVMQTLACLFFAQPGELIGNTKQRSSVHSA